MATIFHSSLKTAHPASIDKQSSLIPPAMIGAGVIIVEIVADRLITISSGFGFIFVAITTALTGIAAGYAIGIRFFSSRDSNYYGTLISLMVLGSSLMVCIGFCGMPVGNSPFLLVVRIAMLLCATLGLFIFNACSGLLLYFMYSQQDSRPPLILFSDLFGAACGLVLLFFIGGFLPYNTLLLAGAILVLWAAIWIIKPNRTLSVAIAVLLLLMAGFPNSFMQPVPVENRRGFHTMSLESESSRYSSLWSDVVLFSGRDGREGVMLFDGGNHSSRIPRMPSNTGNSGFGDKESLPPDPLLATCLKLHPPQRALVIGSAGGIEVLCLKKAGTQHIDAVNQDRMVLKSLGSEFGRMLTQVYDLAGVHTKVTEGRRFVRTHPGIYDAIVVREANPDAGAMHSAGASAVSTLATTEGLKDLLSGLSKDGLLIVETDLGVFWYRIFASQLGQSWRDHVMTVSNEWTMAHVVSKRPFSDQQRTLLNNLTDPKVGNHMVCCDSALVSSPFMKEILDNGGVPGYQVSTDEKPYYIMLRPWFSRGFSLEGAPKRIVSDPLFSAPVSLVHFLLTTFCILSVWIGIHSYTFARRRSRSKALAVSPLLFAFVGGMGFCFYEISLVRVSYQMAGNLLHAWSISLLACLLGASVSALFAHRIKSRRAFCFMGGSALILLAGMKFFLAKGLATFPWNPSILSDIILFVTYTPLAFFLALPLSLLTAMEKDRTTALPALFIANALGALASAPLSLLISLSWGHGGTLMFLFFVLITLMGLRFSLDA
ncbi:MAG: hypothetical protein JEZ02_11075 [Desulfatibacillum sp.]|nr:hypothetical protein [Desulfatibacillum sp.]